MINYDSSPLIGRWGDFDCWGLIDLIPDHVREIIQKYDNPTIKVTETFDELPKDCTIYQYSATNLLEAGEGYRIIQSRRCLAGRTVTSLCVQVRPARQRIVTNASLAERPDEGCYIECYGEFPCSKYLSEEWSSELALCTRRVWNIWGDELPSNTPVIVTRIGWLKAFKAGAQ